MVPPPTASTVHLAEPPSLFRRPEFGLMTLEDMEWKTPGVVDVLTSDKVAPRLVLIEILRNLGGNVRKWRRVCLVSHEHLNSHGDARTTHQPDTGTSGMEHPNPGSVGLPVQLDGICTGNPHQWAPIDTPFKVRDHFLQSP